MKTTGLPHLKKLFLPVKDRRYKSAPIKTLPVSPTSSMELWSNSETAMLNTPLDYLEEIAIVCETIHPYLGGRIYFQASSWPAICEQNVVLPIGRVVRVVGISNITRIVEPFSL
jgi:hypothetical protein